MNFRTCKYFLTVCEMGTINAAARKLYISQQSLSEHMRKLESELGVQLFHRDTPLSLTEAGLHFRTAATEILSALDRMDRELNRIKGHAPSTLVIGCLDYGTPDFLTPLVEIFLKRVPNTLLQTREILPGDPIPPDIPILISARELGSPYKCENLFSDQLVLCLSDTLIEKIYGTEAEARRRRLEQGDIHAIQECPFVLFRNTPLHSLSELVFEKNSFTPTYLPVAGSPEAMTQLCIDGMAAMISFRKHSESLSRQLPIYPLRNIPESVPTGFISYRADCVLSNPARRFLEITRQYFRRG